MHEPPITLPAAGPNEPVEGVIIACNDERASRGIFSSVQVPPSHQIHQQGILAPLTALVGVPILVWRHIEQDPFTIERSSGLDNQIVTYLMIQPHNGLADMMWQLNVGTVTVVRQDRKPLTLEAIEALWQFCSSIISDSDGLQVPTERMTPEGFGEFCQKYKQRMIRDGKTRFKSLSIPI
ncbi:hypothetical protein DENSPDRAFT_837077 [Dentipellis sp. KUC8613]|nr:hypothetical protein DENSPDRAFT_837077 [Dentipellis sp. KUC8613]